MAEISRTEKALNLGMNTMVYSAAQLYELGRRAVVGTKDRIIPETEEIDSVGDTLYAVGSYEPSEENYENYYLGIENRSVEERRAVVEALHKGIGIARE